MQAWFACSFLLRRELFAIRLSLSSLHEEDFSRVARHPPSSSATSEVSFSFTFEYYVVRFENPRREALVDDVKGSVLKAEADPRHASRLTTRVPPPKAKFAFLETTEDGATALNIVGETDSKKKLLDIIGPLDEGTPGLLGPPGDNKLTNQVED